MKNGESEFLKRSDALELVQRGAARALAIHGIGAVGEPDVILSAGSQQEGEPEADLWTVTKRFTGTDISAIYAGKNAIIQRTKTPARSCDVFLNLPFLTIPIGPGNNPSFARVELYAVTAGGVRALVSTAMVTAPAVKGAFFPGKWVARGTVSAPTYFEAVLYFALANVGVPGSTNVLTLVASEEEQDRAPAGIGSCFLSGTVHTQSLHGAAPFNYQVTSSAGQRLVRLAGMNLTTGGGAAVRYVQVNGYQIALQPGQAMVAVDAEDLEGFDGGSPGANGSVFVSTDAAGGTAAADGDAWWGVQYK